MRRSLQHRPRTLSIFFHLLSLSLLLRGIHGMDDFANTDETTDNGGRSLENKNAVQTIEASSLGQPEAAPLVVEPFDNLLETITRPADGSEGIKEASRRNENEEIDELESRLLQRAQLDPGFVDDLIRRLSSIRSRYKRLRTEWKQLLSLRGTKTLEFPRGIIAFKGLPIDLDPLDNSEDISGVEIDPTRTHDLDLAKAGEEKNLESSVEKIIPLEETSTPSILDQSPAIFLTPFPTQLIPVKASTSHWHEQPENGEVEQQHEASPSAFVIQSEHEIEDITEDFPIDDPVEELFPETTTHASHGQSIPKFTASNSSPFAPNFVIPNDSEPQNEISLPRLPFQEEFQDHQGTPREKSHELHNIPFRIGIKISKPFKPLIHIKRHIPQAPPVWAPPRKTSNRQLITSTTTPPSMSTSTTTPTTTTISTTTARTTTTVSTTPSTTDIASTTSELTTNTETTSTQPVTTSEAMTTTTAETTSILTPAQPATRLEPPAISNVSSTPARLDSYHFDVGRNRTVFRYFWRPDQEDKQIILTTTTATPLRELIPSSSASFFSEPLEVFELTTLPATTTSVPLPTPTSTLLSTTSRPIGPPSPTPQFTAEELANASPPSIQPLFEETIEMPSSEELTEKDTNAVVPLSDWLLSHSEVVAAPSIDDSSQKRVLLLAPTIPTAPKSLTIEIEEKLEESPLITVPLPTEPPETPRPPWMPPPTPDTTGQETTLATVPSVTTTPLPSFPTLGVFAEGKRWGVKPSIGVRPLHFVPEWKGPTRITVETPPPTTPSKSTPNPPSPSSPQPSPPSPTPPPPLAITVATSTQPPPLHSEMNSTPPPPPPLDSEVGFVDSKPFFPLIGKTVQRISAEDPMPAQPPESAEQVVPWMPQGVRPTSLAPAMAVAWGRRPPQKPRVLRKIATESEQERSREGEGGQGTEVSRSSSRGSSYEKVDRAIQAELAKEARIHEAVGSDSSLPASASPSPHHHRHRHDHEMATHYHPHSGGSSSRSSEEWRKRVPPAGMKKKIDTSTLFLHALGSDGHRLTSEETRVALGITRKPQKRTPLVVVESSEESLVEERLEKLTLPLTTDKRTAKAILDELTKELRITGVDESTIAACRKTQCDFEGVDLCHYESSPDELAFEDPEFVRRRQRRHVPAPLVRSWGNWGGSHGHSSNIAISTIFKKDINERFAGAQVNPNQIAMLSIQLNSPRRVDLSFLGWEGTRGVQLRVCCDGHCPIQSDVGVRRGQKQWQTMMFHCPPHTKQLSFECINTGDVRGACGIDSLRMRNCDFYL